MRGVGNADLLWFALQCNSNRGPSQIRPVVLQVQVRRVNMLERGVVHRLRQGGGVGIGQVPVQTADASLVKRGVEAPSASSCASWLHSSVLAAVIAAAALAAVARKRKLLHPWHRPPPRPAPAPAVSAATGAAADATKAAADATMSATTAASANVDAAKKAADAAIGAMKK